VQLAGGLGVALVYQVQAGMSIGYIVGVLAAHILMGSVLSSLSALFVTIPDDRPLHRVNLANLLSMVRISSTPMLVLLIVLLRTRQVLPVLVPLASLVFLTDLIDGQISRRSRTVTQIGQFLDSSSDYLLLIVVSIALGIYELIPVWFFVVLGLRFGLQIVGQAILFLVRRGRVEFRSSFLGKASVFATMVFYALALFGLDPLPNWYGEVMRVLEYAVAVVLGISLVEKLWLFATDVSSERK
jgi:phosphatidylglycerophosphate synthase